MKRYKPSFIFASLLTVLFASYKYIRGTGWEWYWYVFYFLTAFLVFRPTCAFVCQLIYKKKDAGKDANNKET